MLQSKSMLNTNYKSTFRPCVCKTHDLAPSHNLFPATWKETSRLPSVCLAKKTANSCRIVTRPTNRTSFNDHTVGWPWLGTGGPASIPQPQIWQPTCGLLWLRLKSRRKREASQFRQHSSGPVLQSAEQKGDQSLPCFCFSPNLYASKSASLINAISESVPARGSKSEPT